MIRFLQLYSRIRRRIEQLRNQDARVARFLAPGSPALVVMGAAALLLLARVLGANPVGAIVFTVTAAIVMVLVQRMAQVRDSVSRLAESEARFRALVQHSSDVILIVDPDGLIHYASRSAADVFGEGSRRLTGRMLANPVHVDDLPVVRRFLSDVQRTTDGPIVAEWRVRRRDGTWLWTENIGTNLLRESSVRGVVVNARDISERRTLEARLTHEAFHDGLTNLANRALFLNRVSLALARVSRAARETAVLFLDLDDFKKVNDSLGHAVGDELLVSAAARLTTCIRPGDTIARLGGDEFAILLEDLENMEAAEAVAERVVTSLRAPFRIGGRDVFVSVSVGIATMSLGDTPDDVLRNADLAMYFAKAQTKGRYAIYAREMHAKVMARLELEADLRVAVAERRFHIEYQPIVHLVTGEVHGAEALLRWQHPLRGPVPPSQFVSMAEETGLIVPIGREVLREACTNARAWRCRRPGRPLRVSVNLSGKHFNEESVIEDVRTALGESGLEPSALTLEITESVLMQRSQKTLQKLRELKALGLNLAIDDFGTGYSSLGYLQQFPIDILKIDRTFVDAVGQEDVDPVLARAIIALGRTLHLETVAEGIERPQQREGLRALGCTLGQGYLFAHPMTADEFSALLVQPMYAPAPPEASQSDAPRIVSGT